MRQRAYRHTKFLAMIVATACGMAACPSSSICALNCGFKAQLPPEALSEHITELQ